jgi:hypothetical protein
MKEAMPAEDWVRLLNLAGSLILFWAAYRGQQWGQTQAKAEDRAAKSRAKTAEEEMAKKSRAEPAGGDTVAEDNTATDEVDPKVFDQAAAEVLSRPYFDRFGFILLCIGFGIAALSGLIDVVSHRSWKVLF